MTSQEILTRLLEYGRRVMAVIGLSPQPGVVVEVSNEYSFITVVIRESGKQFAHVRFEVAENSAKLCEVYCEDRSAEEDITNRIATGNWPGWQSPLVVELPYSREVIQSLQTADEIAVLTVNCAVGDNYHPGSFSKVSVNDWCIELQQINRMHARSLDHKNNYSMRDLVFTIPFERDAVIAKRLGAYQVGSMVVEFSDNSSANNRGCGRSVVEALEKLCNHSAE